MTAVDTAAMTAGPQAGFETLDNEVSADGLAVDGSLPPWLSGSLLRNGPALFEDAERSVRHWFDGQAMLHRFTIAGGAVSYSNRFLRTRAYEAMRDQGEIAYSEFATDPCRSIFKRAMTVFDPKITDNTFVSLTKLGEQHYAMAEGPMSVQFDPQTLETLGYGPKRPGMVATAHPHHDPASGALVNVAIRMGPRNAYRFFVQEAGAGARVLAQRAVREPSYVHSFAMSERFIALTEFPFVVNPIEIPLRGKPFIENFRWEPERGTRICVFDRHTGEQQGTFETEVGFAFHHVGAWERGETLVMEYCDHGDPTIIDALYLDRLRSQSPSRADRRKANLRRVEVDLSAGRVRTELRSDQDLELPRINEERCYLRPYSYVYGIATGSGSTHDVADRLVKVNTETGDSRTWREPNCYPGEPIFVARPGASTEDDGVALSVVLDAGRERSYLLVLDTRSWTEIARAEAPHRIPHGIHGAFYPEVERRDQRERRTTWNR